MKPQLLKPSPHHDHVYAILRYEMDAGEAVPIDLRVTVKKIVTDPHFADQEVRRLNDLNKDKGSYYFVQVTRMEKTPVFSVPVEEPPQFCEKDTGETAQQNSAGAKTF
jgi:hypothetical protein